MKTSLYILTSLLFATSVLPAQTVITGFMDSDIPASDAGWGLSAQRNMTSLTDVSTGNAVFGGSGQAFCFSPHLGAPLLGSTVQYTAYTSPSLFSYSGGAARGQEALYWLFDNYYDGYIINETGYTTSERVDRHHAFQAIVWEIQDDLAGTDLGVLSLDTGNYIKPTTYAGYTLGSSILQNLQAANIPTGYTSSQFSFAYLQSDGTSQNQLLVTSVVPEPSGALLAGAAGLVGLLQRKRTKKVTTGRPERSHPEGGANTIAADC